MQSRSRLSWRYCRARRSLTTVIRWCSSSCRAKPRWSSSKRRAPTSTTASSPPMAADPASAVVNDDGRRAARGAGLPGRQGPPDAGRRRRAARRARQDHRRRGGRQGRADRPRRRQEQEGHRRHRPRAACRLLGGRLRRYLSIEGTTTEAAITGRNYTGPALQAAWFAADGTQIGSGQLSAILDTDVTPAAYLYHGSRFRIGNVGDGGMPSFVRISAPNGDVATLDAKKWPATAAPPAPAASSRTSTRTT